MLFVIAIYIQQNKLYTNVPLDFVPKNKSLSKTQLDDRVVYWDALDKRTGNDKGEPSAELKGDKLKEKIFGVRDITFSLCKSRINRFFRQQMNERFLDLHLKDGREVTCIKDFAEYVKHAPSGNELREQLFFALHGLWGTANEWADDVEDEIMELFSLRYTAKLCNGLTKQKICKGGCFKTLAVKYRHIQCEPIKNAAIKYHQECVYVRDKVTPKTEDPGDHYPDIVDLDDTTAGINKKGLIKLHNATDRTHGFFGYLGIFAGHPSCEELEQAVTPAAKPTFPNSAFYPEDTPENSVYFSWFRKKMQDQDIKSFSDIARLASEEVFARNGQDSVSTPAASSIMLSFSGDENDLDDVSATLCPASQRDIIDCCLCLSIYSRTECQLYYCHTIRGSS